VYVINYTCGTLSQHKIDSVSNVLYHRSSFHSSRLDRRACQRRGGVHEKKIAHQTCKKRWSQWDREVGLCFSAYVHRSLLGPGASMDEDERVVALFHHSTDYRVRSLGGRVACFLLLLSSVGAMLCYLSQTVWPFSPIYTCMAASTPCSMHMDSFACAPPKQQSFEYAVIFSFVTRG
jgi:hypothetical protein